MPKATIEFNLDLPEDINAFKRATKATEAYISFFRIGQEVFRPNRKHGYGDPELQKLVENNPAASEAIELLEKKFYEILEEEGIDLNDLE
jgi:hypothetical protein